MATTGMRRAVSSALLGSICLAVVASSSPELVERYPPGASRQLLQFGICPSEVSTNAFGFLGDRTTFAHPEVNGVKLDFCSSLGDGCGRLAADGFCQSRGFAEAETFFQWRTAIRDCGSTVAIQTGDLCTSNQCSGFRIIVCRGSMDGGSGLSLLPTPAGTEPAPNRPRGMRKRRKAVPGIQDDLPISVDPIADEGSAMAPQASQGDEDIPPELLLIPDPAEQNEATELQPPQEVGQGAETPSVVQPRQGPEPVASAVPAQPSVPDPPRRRKAPPTESGSSIPEIPSDESTGLSLGQDMEACSQAGLLGAFSAANSACREVTLTCSMNGTQLLGGRRRALKKITSEVEKQNSAIADIPWMRGYQQRGLTQAVSEECKGAFMESCLSTASQQTTNIKGACKELLLNGPPQPYPGCSSFGEVERIFSKGINSLCTETLEDFLP